MKYFIISDEPHDALLKLKEQLSQLDIRGEFECLRSDGRYQSINNQLKSQTPDVLILLGSSRINIKLISYLRCKGIKTCYIQLEYVSHSIQKFNAETDLILITNPADKNHLKQSNNAHYIGNPITDLIKDYNFDPTFSLNGNEVNVAVLIGEEKIRGTVSKLIYQIATNAPSFKFHISAKITDQSDHYKLAGKLPNLVVHREKSYDILKNCNVAITAQGQNSLEAALLNCPQVIINKSRFSFFRRSKQVPILNSITEKKVVKEVKTVQEALNEINLILNDQRYCANMLAEYQVIKDKIGHERAFKNAARIIVDFLESSSA